MGGKTTTQSNEPWGAAKPALETTLKDAGKLYEQGIGGRTWTGMTNAPMTSMQTGGLDHMSNTATGYLPWLNTGAQRLDNIASAGISDPSMSIAQQNMQAHVGGYGEPDAGQINQIGNRAQSDPYATAFGSLASGAQNDPFRSQYSALGAGAQNNPYSSGFNSAMSSAQVDPYSGRFDAIGSAAQNDPNARNFNRLARSATADPFMSQYSQLGGAVQNNPFMSKVSGLTDSATNNPAMQGYSAMSGQGGPSSSEQNLSSVASGSMLNGGDPNFERALEAASRKAADAVNMSASGAGRYGGGIHQGNLAREVGDLQANARVGQYNTERGRQVEANSLIDSFRNAQDQTRLGALGGLANTFQGGQSQALNAALGGGNMYMGGLGQALDAARGGSAAYGAGQDRSLNATQAGSSNRLAGNAQALNAAQAGSNSYRQGVDQYLNATQGGANTFLAGNNQALNAAQAGTNSIFGGMDRALNASQAGSNAYQTGLGNSLNAFNSAANIHAGNADRRIGATNNLFNMGQTGVGNQLNAFDRMNSAYDMALRPGQTSFDVGQRYQDQAQNVLNDQMRIFDDTQNQPWNQLSRYNAIAQGMGGLGGTQTARSGGGFGDVLGGLLGVLGGFG